MALTNLGFETPDVTAGSALAWTRTEVITAERAAVWGTLALDDEEFEAEWNNDDALFAFNDPLIQLETAIFNFTLDAVSGADSFEMGWDGNQGYAFELDSTDYAQFGAGLLPIEAFEVEWDANEDYDFTLPATTVALFNGGNTIERFEINWRYNESYIVTWPGDTDPASFQVGLSGGSIETFESGYLEQGVSVTAGTDYVALTAQPFANGNKVKFRLIGEGALPGGFTTGGVYWVVNQATNQFQVSHSLGGSAIDITDNGSGTIVVGRDPDRYWTIAVDDQLVP